MIKIKNQRGITLVTLIITIILIIILASVGIYEGTQSIDYSRMVKFVAYMQAIQKKVDFISQYEVYENLGQNLDSEKISKLQTILTNENERFITTTESSTLKYFNSNLIAQQLDIDDIDDEIVIDFLTREVISLNGIEYEGEMYYSQYYLPAGQKIANGSNNNNRSISFDIPTVSVNGLNATFTISDISISNGTLSYSLNYETENPTWIEITNNTQKNQNITTQNITRSGVYYFRLVDNLNYRNEYISEGISLVLTNAPQENNELNISSELYNYSDYEESIEDFSYATKIENSNEEYVWIPRFAYKTADTTNIEFLKGTSDLTTSGGYITNEWTVPSAFTDVTGVWVRTNSYSSNNILDIIETGTILQ